jgi:hypothetical protein
MIRILRLTLSAITPANGIQIVIINIKRNDAKALIIGSLYTSAIQNVITKNTTIDPSKENNCPVQKYR